MRNRHLPVLSLCVMLAIFVSASITIAADDIEPRNKLTNIRAVTPKREAPGARPDRQKRPIGDKSHQRKQMKRLDQGIKQRQKQQKEFIAELNAIKELALKEGAKETAKRLDAVIKDQEARFAKTMENVRRSRDRVRGRLVGQYEPEVIAKEDVKVEPKVEPKEDTKKEGSWWKFWK